MSTDPRDRWGDVTGGRTAIGRTSPVRRGPLEGVRVLVPRDAADHPICRAVERRGGVPVPVALTRLEPAAPAVIGNALAMLAASAWALFLTRRAADVLAADGRPLTPLIGVARMTSGLRVAAADEEIAGALRDLGVPVDLTPLRGSGAAALALSLPRGPGAPRDLRPAALPSAPGGPPPLPALPAHLADAVPHLPAGIAGLLARPGGGGGAEEGAASASATAGVEVPLRERRAVLLGSDVVDPAARTLVGALGWEVAEVTLHTTEPAPLSAAEVSAALAHRSAGLPRWPGIVILTSATTVRALLRSVGAPPSSVAIAAADEATARAALDAGLRVDAIAATTSHDAFAAAAAGAWQRAWADGHVG